MFVQKNVAKFVAENYATTSMKAAEAQGVFGQAGFKPAEIAGMLSSNFDVVEATRAESDQVANLIGNIKTAFNLDATAQKNPDGSVGKSDDMSFLANLITKTSNTSKSSVESLTESSKYLLDKPQGFAVIGAAETADFLRDKPVRLIWGVGPAAQDSLERAGIHTFSDLLRWDQRDLTDRFGSMGYRLWHLARGEDARKITARAPVKSISKETTFFEDTANLDILDGHLWRLSEQVADRAKAKSKAGRVVTLKLKRANFSLISRRQSLRDATQMTDTIYATARSLFDSCANQGPFRLIGVGISDIVEDSAADLSADLLDPKAAQRRKAERATDQIRARFGSDAILKGRAMR